MTDEWHAWRAQGIGASDVAGILGISPWASPYSVWAEKVGLVTPDDIEVTEQMMMGQAMEPTIARLFHDKTGLYVSSHQLQVEHPTLTWARSTLDGVVYEALHHDEDDHGYFGVPVGVAEFKTTPDSPKVWEEAIPNHYAAQLQWQMFTTELDMGWLCVLHVGFSLRFRVYEVPRDEADIAFIVERVTRFWRDHVLANVPPEADGHQATTETLRGLPVDPDACVDLDDVADLLASLRDLRAEGKYVEGQIAEAENRIKARMGECTEGFVDGERVVSWRPQSRAMLNLTQLRTDHPELAEQYGYQSESRVFRLAKQK